jgi:hypothetical protein
MRLIVVVSAALLASCNNVHLAPKIVSVDGKQTAFACSGTIQVSGSERGAYEVSLTDKGGDRDWRGLSKVEIDDMPAELERSICHDAPGHEARQNTNGPAPESHAELPPEYVESLRKRNVCEERFRDKKIVDVGGTSVYQACKENPDSKP